MQFTVTAAAFLAFVAKAMAQTPDFDPIFTPEAWSTVNAGESFKITWDAPAKYAGQKITISLIGGESQNTQVPIKDIATGVNNDDEAFSWSVDSALGDANVYGLVFKLESNPAVFQYSNPFKIDGDAAPVEKPTYEKPAGAPTTTLTAPHGVKTVSLVTSQVPTTIIPVVKTETVPCNTTAPVVIPVTQTHTIVEPCHGNCTHPTTAPVQPPVNTHPVQPPVYTHPVEPSKPVVPVVPTHPVEVPVVPTPTPVTVTGAASRFGASVAAIGGLVIAALAL